jgi:tRNA dimethylallyltransferase
MGAKGDMDKIAAIVGPTAIGKSAIAVEVASLLNGQVISVDSVQVYKYLNIGSAKITDKEMIASNGHFIKHHLLDFWEPSCQYNVSDFKLKAEQEIKELNQKSILPILVGGTGLYINSLLYPYEFVEMDSSAELRSELIAEADNHGNEFLHQKLKVLDPVSAEKLHPNDLKRVMRAIEVAVLTGEPIWKNHGHQYQSKFDTILIGLNMERSELYNRINLRVDQMIDNGFIKEVMQLLEMGYTSESPGLQTMGYKQICRYLMGQYSLEEAIEEIKKETRRYAKRQLTWFKKDPNIHWFDLTEKVDIISISQEIADLIGRTINIGVE